jgi:hypothetical protein
MYEVQQSSTTPLLFFMADSTDRTTGKTGLTPTVTLSKNGAAFAAAHSTAAEIGNGWYKAGDATDTNATGPLLLHATASGAETADVEYIVVAFDPTASILAKLGVSKNATLAADVADETEMLLALLRMQRPELFENLKNVANPGLLDVK